MTPTHILVANIGDSRAVLCRSPTTVVPMSVDQKPANPLEAKRIYASGGSVQNGRVNGDLAVARALGDFVYKDKVRELVPARDGMVSRLATACGVLVAS